MKNRIWISAAALLLLTVSAFGAQEKTAQPVAAEQDLAALSVQEKVSAPGENTLLSRLLFYVPNRLADLSDIFSLELRMGAGMDVSASVTRAFGLGFGFGPYGALIKDINRQYGMAVQQTTMDGAGIGWHAQFLFLQAEDTMRVCTLGSVKPYWKSGCNFPLPSEEVYLLRTGARDYWALEVAATLLAGARVAVHPVEIIDLLLGCFCIDIMDDDVRIRTDFL